MKCYHEINAMVNGSCEIHSCYKKNNLIRVRKNVSYIVCGIIIKNRRILLQQESKKPFIDKWYIPGGKVEKKENLESALIREVKEEAGVMCHPLSITSIECDKGRWFRFIFNCNIQDEPIKVEHDVHSKKAQWFDLEEIFKHKVNLRYYDIIEKLKSDYYQNYIMHDFENYNILPNIVPHTQLAAQLLIICHIESPKLVSKLLVDHNRSLPVFDIYQDKFTNITILKNYILDIFNNDNEPYEYKMYGVLSLEHCGTSNTSNQSLMLSDGLILGFLIVLKFNILPTCNTSFKLKRLNSGYKKMLKDIINKNMYIPFKFIHL